MDSIFHALLGSRNTENPNISNPATARQFDWNDFISYFSFLACGALGRLRWESWCFLWQHLVGGAGISEQLSVQWGGEPVRGVGDITWLHILTWEVTPPLPSLWQGKWCGDSYWDIMAMAWLSPSSSIEMERTLKCIININQKSCQSSQIKAHNAVLTTQADKQL